MNKKIGKLVFIIVLFFSMGNNVLAACGEENGDVCIQLAGEGKVYEADYQSADKYKSANITDKEAFRITLVDNDGNRYKYNEVYTKSYDYYVNGDYRLSGNYYYNEYKYSSTVEWGNEYLVGRDYSIKKGNADFSQENGISNFWKNKLGVGGNEITNDLRTVLTNAGISNSLDQDEILTKGDLYIVIERLYRISINYLSEERTEKVTLKIVEPTCKTACPECDCLIDYTISYKVRDNNQLNFVGTGKSIANLLNSYNNDSGLFGVKKQNINDLDFVRSNAFANDIGAMRIKNKNEIITWKFGPKKDGETSLSLTTLTDNAWISKSDINTKWSEIANKLYTLDLLILKISVAGGNTNECENQTDADALNRSWTGGACCDPGKIYNSITKVCSGKKAYTPPGGTTNTYVYGCSPTADICKSNLDSTINNLGEGTRTVNSKNETELNSDNIGECVLYNDKYKVDYNGTTIYCSETLNTDFSNPISGFSANFSSSYTNGKFIPINNMPSLNKKVTCYAPSSVNTDVLKNYSKSFNNKTSNMNISVNFLGSETYKFSNNDITVKNVSGISNAKTAYGKTYNKISFDLEYDYSYSSASLNKYISIETAKASTTKIGTAQKTMLNDVNFKIPTGTASGTYTSSIMINNLDNKISNINNETDYKETFTSGSNPGYCVLTYNKKVSAATCTRKYNTYLDKGNVAGYEITYGEGQVDNTGIYPKSDCQFEIKYTGITEDYCESLPGDDTNISTEYHTTGNTTELKFKNTKIQPSLSCNFSFDVQEKIDDILVYRPIDLSNPFPGKDGSGREIGANWDRLDGNLTYEQKYITNRQDVYTKTPLYSVTLTPAQIKEIRNYNKENPYDEFELECNEKGSACYSSFIRKYLNTNKSVCANTNEKTTEKFNSCADYSKR